MTTAPRSTQRVLAKLRGHLLRSGSRVRDAGWQDLEEALADIDVTRAAIELGQPEGWARAQILLGNEGPIRLLSVQCGWEGEFLNIVNAAEPAIAAQ
ncbi:MAG: hypothetical protein AAGH87_00455 [Pseudomonadota bacterium]